MAMGLPVFNSGRAEMVTASGVCMTRRRNPELSRVRSRSFLPRPQEVQDFIIIPI